jgi:hypothetical protein
VFGSRAAVRYGLQVPEPTGTITLIRVYAVGGRRLAVLPHTPEPDIRDEALALARQELVERVLVIDRDPAGDEAVVEEITVALTAGSGDAGPTPVPV